MINKKYQEELVKMLLIASKDIALFEAVLLDLLTPAEYGEIVVRWQIVKRLAKGESQRSIARDLKIGIATVTRGSRELMDSTGGFAQVLIRMKK
jgi:TrpR family trp operon transcriptional repressor